MTRALMTPEGIDTNGDIVGFCDLFSETASPLTSAAQRRLVRHARYFTLAAWRKPLDETLFRQILGRIE